MATYQEQIERHRREREAKEKTEIERKAKQLTPEQIKNWRGVLSHIVGPFAFVMSEEMVRHFHDVIQAKLSKDDHAESVQLASFLSTLRRCTL